MAGAGLSGSKVVYVEDDVLTQGVVEAALADAGFHVLLAETAEAGLALLEVQAEEIVGLVTDIQLGGGTDGWDLARRSRELHPTLPVVYVSGTDGPDWCARGVPASVMIAKPFSPAQVVVALASLINEAPVV